MLMIGLRTAFKRCLEIVLKLQHWLKISDVQMKAPLTLNDAITMAEASISLLPADETEAIRQLSENLEIFREIKAFQEEGGHVNVEFKISVGGE